MDDLLGDLLLPLAMREEFLAIYVEPDYQGGGSSSDGNCSRCKARVPWSHWDGHRTWHRNVSLKIWLVEAWILAHLEKHTSGGTI